MTVDEMKELKKGIVLTAAYYNRDIKLEVVSMMAEDLSDLSFQEVSAAYLSYRRDPKNKTFPLPAQIREIVRPEVTPLQVGREISALILEAITRFGYSNGADARQYIGDIGWSLVRSFGGWSYLCQNMGVTIQPGQFIAQCREMGTDRFQHGSNITTVATAIDYEREGAKELEWQNKKQEQINAALAKFQLKSVPQIE